MSFEVSPKGRDFSLEISGIGYQTLSKVKVIDTIGILDDRLSRLVDGIKPNPFRLDFNGMMLKLHTFEGMQNLHAELKKAITQMNEE